MLITEMTEAHRILLTASFKLTRSGYFCKTLVAVDVLSSMNFLRCSRVILNFCSITAVLVELTGLWRMNFSASSISSFEKLAEGSIRRCLLKNIKMKAKKKLIVKKKIILSITFWLETPLRCLPRSCSDLAIFFVLCIIPEPQHYFSHYKLCPNEK